ncbi:MAG: YciI family protein [Pirellulaceae bacterium]|nr:YciI family protein [Pirellulaceae bacterium]
MKYMLLIYMAEDAMNEAEREQCFGDSTKLCHELAARQQFVAASPLLPVATASSLRVREGKRLVTDGPFAETREQLGGYFLIDVKNLDEALAIAARIPAAKKGTVEVRPVMELPGLPPA